MEKRVVIIASWKHALAVTLLANRIESETDGRVLAVDFTEDQACPPAPAPNEADIFNSYELKSRRNLRRDQIRQADCVVFLGPSGPSGMDAAIEVGMAMAHGIPVLGWQRQPHQGLHAAAITWVKDLNGLLEALNKTLRLQE